MPEALSALLSRDDAVVQLPAGQIHVHEPIVLPDRPLTIRGAGIGATEIICYHDGDGLVSRRAHTLGPLTLSDFQHH